MLTKLITDDFKKETPQKDSLNKFTFRNERYLYYQNNITEEPNNASNYLQMIEYLRELVKEQNTQICTMELFDDIILWTDKLISRCFRTTSKLSDKETALMYKVEAYIHTGRLAEATELLLKTKKFRVLGFRGSDWGDRVSYRDGILAWNLLAAFKQIDYAQGCRLITNKLNGFNDFNEGWIKRNYYDTNILGNLFIYPMFRFSTAGSGKTKHLDLFGFKKCDITDPMYFYEKFYKKSSAEYANEIDTVFKLHGIL